MSSFATSYIPTTTATATRAADSASMTGTNFSSWYNQTQGTFVVEGDVPYPTGVASRYLEASDGTPSQALLIAQSTTIGAQISSTGGPFTGTVTTGIVKLALAYASNDAAFTYNATAVQTDATVTLPTPTRLEIGFSTPTANRVLNGHIRSLRFFNVRLSNAQLQALTT